MVLEQGIRRDISTGDRRKADQPKHCDQTIRSKPFADLAYRLAHCALPALDGGCSFRCLRRCFRPGFVLQVISRPALREPLAGCVPA